MNITPSNFEAALRFLTTYYTPVSLEEVLSDSHGRGLPSRPVLVTFDDGYASLAEWAAPLCCRYGVPAVFFINAAFLDNQRLAPDNLVCYVANTLGMETICAAARTAHSTDALYVHKLSDVFTRFFPRLTLPERDIFLAALRELAGLNEKLMAKEAALYLTSAQVFRLASLGFEIGNHTYSHVHGRSLLRTDFPLQVGRNKAELETLARKSVRSFSQPYGSSADLTPELAEYLDRSEYKAVFFSEGVANHRGTDPFHIDRISTRAESHSTLFFELETLPRLRAFRNRLFGRVARSEHHHPFFWQSANGANQKERAQRDLQEND